MNIENIDSENGFKENEKNLEDSYINPSKIFLKKSDISSFRIKKLMPYIWLAGIFFLAIYSFMSTFSFKNKLRKSQLIKDNIYENENIETAFVFGLIKPKIYLPKNLNKQEKKYVLAHEEVHISRFDHISKFLAFLITIIHWFNPLVLASYYLMGLDMELSCDEKVLKDFGLDIKKDYSYSLLSFSSKKRLITASPIAFGEKNTKTRIKNILSYKKPKVWISLISIILISGTLLACFTRAPKEIETSISENGKIEQTLTETVEEIKTPQEHAEIFIEDRINEYISFGHKISESRINSFEKLNEFKYIYNRPLELWKLDYSLKAENPEEFQKGLDAKFEEDGWTSELEYGPFLLLEKTDQGYKFLGNIANSTSDYNIGLEKSQQEAAIRYFLAFENKELASFPGPHKNIRFSMPDGNVMKVLISKPISQNEKGIWIVERMIDSYGNVYIWPYSYQDMDLESYEFFEILQEKVNTGKETWRLDPEKVAMDYVTTQFSGYVLRDDNFVLEEDESVEFFYEVPSSTKLGYFMDYNPETSDLSASLDIDLVEWISDEEHFKSLGIENESFEDFYIYNPTTYPDSTFLTKNTQYRIIDWDNWTEGEMPIKEVTTDEFMFYAQTHSNPFLIRLVSKNGRAIEVSEVYLP